MNIPEHILKDIKWEAFPLYPVGGQTVGFNYAGSTLIHDDLGFKISISNYRSQIKNKQLCLTLFELYLLEITTKS